MDNSIARHGLHGFYRHYGVSIPHTVLKQGPNSIFLKISDGAHSPFVGLIYDYIRLESPPPNGPKCPAVTGPFGEVGEWYNVTDI